LGPRAVAGQAELRGFLDRNGFENLRAAGILERVIMEIAGHKTRSTFDRYGIVNERDMRSALEAVEQDVVKLPAGEKMVVTFPNSPANSPPTA